MASLRSKYPKEYRIWLAMRARCHAPSQKDSPYQKKGIKVCERWNSFENFITDMGPRPPKHSIDRINNDADYSPENCRWATQDIQCKNRGSFNRYYSFNGKTLCLKDWARETGIDYTALIGRIERHPDLAFEEIINFKDPNKEPIIYEGKEYTRKELCDKYNISLKLFYDRYHKGWPLERILNTPKLKSRYDERNYFANRTKESAEL